MINILICEDDKKSREKLQTLLNKGRFIEAIKMEAYKDGKSLLEATKSLEICDVLFLDIVLGEENGFEIAKEIRKINPQLMIVITTTIIEYAMDGYAINALDFLLKPIDQLEFDRVVKRINRGLQLRESHKHVFMKNGQKIIVDLDEVIYIESFGRKICLYYENNTKDEFYQKLKDLESRLKDGRFFRCHRSYIINMSYVKSVKRKEVVLKNNKMLPVSKGNNKALYDLYTRYMLEG